MCTARSTVVSNTPWRLSRWSVNPGRLPLPESCRPPAESHSVENEMNLMSELSNPETAPPLLRGVRVGPYDLPNRVVMAPLTRMRAGAGNVPQPLSAEYYRQRAGAGLIVSEATPVSPYGHGY